MGFVTHQGELRRVEGLSGSSRLSGPLDAACGHLEAGSRWALCQNDGSSTLIDLFDIAAAARELPGAPAAFERAVWSPGGTAVALDRLVFVLPSGTSPRAQEGEILALSDTGLAAVRDADGSVRLNGEIVAGADAAAVAFDGEALLIASEGSLRRVQPGRSFETFPLSVGTRFLASDDAAFYAANARTVIRIDRITGESSAFDLPVEEVRITRLDRLADGSWLLASPGLGEPGWLFRNGSFSFIPGIAGKTEAEQ